MSACPGLSVVCNESNLSTGMSRSEIGLLTQQKVTSRIMDRSRVLLAENRCDLL